MHIIEPCCTQKHWPEIRKKIGNDGTTFFHGYGDLSINELFPVLFVRYSGVNVTIVCPNLPNTAADILKHWMDKPGVISHLTVITNLNYKKSPNASKWVKENPWPERLKLHNVQQNDTAILLPDIAIYGAINMVNSGHFTALATTNQRVIRNLMSVYESLVNR